MTRILRILILEDRPADAELVMRELSKAGIPLVTKWVKTEAEFLAQLRDSPPDLILADYSLPAYDGLAALAAVRKKHPETPFIFVSGTLGEETAIEALHHGATDYVLKQRLSRLGPAVRRALEEIAERNQLQQAEELLRGSEARFRSVWEHSVDGMRLTDREGRILAVNDAFCRLVNLPREKLIGELFSVAYAGHGPDEGIEAYQRRFDTGTIESRVTTRTRLWNSERIDVEISSSFVELGHQGKTLLSIFRDITERKNSDRRIAALSNLGQKLSAARTAREAAEIIVEVADQLLGWDACSFALFSPAEKLMRQVLTRDTVEGRRIEANSAYDHPSPPSSLANRAIVEGGQLILKEEPDRMQPGGLPFGDKSRPSASLLFVPIRKGSDVIGVLSIQSYTPQAYDQHSLGTLQALADHCGAALDRITTEETLRTAQQQLRQSQKMEAIGQLAGGVAHDFNNMLAVIRGNAELLLMNADQHTPRTKECLSQVIAASERAANLTRQLLAFSRKQVMQSRPLVLNDVIADLTKMLRRIIGEDIDLQCRYGAAVAVRPGRPRHDRAGPREPRGQRPGRHAPGRPTAHHDRIRHL